MPPEILRQGNIPLPFFVSDTVLPQFALKEPVLQIEHLFK